MEIWRQKHPDKMYNQKRRKVMQYASKHTRVPTQASVKKYNIQCDELSRLLVHQINFVCKAETCSRS